MFQMRCHFLIKADLKILPDLEPPSIIWLCQESHTTVTMLSKSLLCLLFSSWIFSAISQYCWASTSASSLSCLAYSSSLQLRAACTLGVREKLHVGSSTGITTVSSRVANHHQHFTLCEFAPHKCALLHLFFYHWYFLAHYTLLKSPFRSFPISLLFLYTQSRKVQEHQM